MSPFWRGFWTVFGFAPSRPYFELPELNMPPELPVSSAQWVDFALLEKSEGTGVMLVRDKNGKLAVVSSSEFFQQLRDKKLQSDSPSSDEKPVTEPRIVRH
jgi:hypothetical protein